MDLYLKQLRTMMSSSSGVRRAGAAALNLAYVACGRLDAFWELGLSPWDAGRGRALLVQEAGGLVERLGASRLGSVRRHHRSRPKSSPPWSIC
jgi:myo-inositol-1(or 4)-monophosphatase